MNEPLPSGIVTDRFTDPAPVPVISSLYGPALGDAMTPRRDADADGPNGTTTALGTAAVANVATLLSLALLRPSASVIDRVTGAPVALPTANERKLDPDAAICATCRSYSAAPPAM